MSQSGIENVMNAVPGLLSTLTGNTGVATAVANNINDLGSGSITTVGSGSTLNTSLTGLTNHSVLVGAGTATITKLTVGTNGQVLIGSTAADPAFATLTSSDGSITFTTGPNSLSLQNTLGTGRFPITPYVVGLVGIAGYQTIQSALTAANSAGGGIVYVQPGTYNENLTLYTNTQVIGAGFGDTGSATIVGVHTPPASGNFAFKNLTLQSTTDIFNSVVAGTSSLFVIDCLLIQTNGYTFNIPNWTSAATLVLFDIGDLSTNNGVINNTGGAAILFDVVTVGAGSGNTMNVSGNITFNVVQLGCPINFQTGSSISVDNSIFSKTVTLSNNSTGTFNGCRYTTGATTPITMSSSASMALNNSVINSSSNPVIAGSGAGTLTLGDVTFINGKNIAGTLTLAGATGFYPTSGTNGQVFLAATGGAGTFATLTSTGGTILFTTGANSLNLESVAGGITWTDITSATQTLAINNGYVTNRGGGVAYTLPATATEGNIIRIAGKSGAWSIAQNANQQINVGSASSTVGVTGSVASTNAGDCIELLCTTSGASTVWRAISYVGNLTVA